MHFEYVSTTLNFNSKPLTYHHFTMNKILKFLSVTAIILMSSQVYAQESGLPEEGTIKVGAGLVFGSGIGFGNLDNDIGLRADGYYSITPEIRAGADFTFFFPKSQTYNGFGGEYTDKVTVWELNLNGNYYLLENEGIRVYGLAGINITGFSYKTKSGGQSMSNSDSELGLNLGAGAEYGLDFGDLFGELKYGGLGGDADQFGIGVGVRFDI